MGVEFQEKYSEGQKDEGGRWEGGGESLVESTAVAVKAPAPTAALLALRCGGKRCKVPKPGAQKRDALCRKGCPRVGDHEGRECGGEWLSSW